MKQSSFSIRSSRERSPHDLARYSDPTPPRVVYRQLQGRDILMLCQVLIIPQFGSVGLETLLTINRIPLRWSQSSSLCFRACLTSSQRFGFSPRPLVLISEHFHTLAVLPFCPHVSFHNAPWLFSYPGSLQHDWQPAGPFITDRRLTRARQWCVTCFWPKIDVLNSHGPPAGWHKAEGSLRRAPLQPPPPNHPHKKHCTKRLFLFLPFCYRE